MPSESEGGQSRRDYNCTNMANTAMVFTTSEDDSCHTSGTSTEGKLASDSEQEGTTPIMEDNVSDGMQSIRMSLQKHGLSPATVNIMLQSWRSGTKKQYSTYARKWIQFCGQNKRDPYQANIKTVLDFMTSLFESGLGYSALNTARSALSAICFTRDSVTVGTHPLVVRFMRGVFNMRPTLPRYKEIWDVSKVLLYLKSLPPVKQLTLKMLTLKLVMLIALVTAARGQSLHLLDIRYSGIEMLPQIHL